jgi:hypothetical protein
VYLFVCIYRVSCICNSAWSENKQGHYIEWLCAYLCYPRKARSRQPVGPVPAVLHLETLDVVRVLGFPLSHHPAHGRQTAKLNLGNRSMNQRWLEYMHRSFRISSITSCKQTKAARKNNCNNNKTTPDNHSIYICWRLICSRRSVSNFRGLSWNILNSAGTHVCARVCVSCFFLAKEITQTYRLIPTNHHGLSRQ